MLKLALFTLISVFFLSLGTLVILSKKPICIDSTIVERIDIVSDQGSYTAYKCDLDRKVPYSFENEKLVNEVSRRISKAEKKIFQLGNWQVPIRLTLIKSIRDFVKINNREIIITQDRVLETNDLLRAMIKVWLRDQAKGHLPALSLAEEALTDLIQYSFGDLDPAIPSELKWPLHLSSQGHLCRQNSASMESRHTCRLEKSEVNEKISLYSVRSFFSSVVIEAFLKSNFHRRLELIRSIAKLNFQNSQLSFINLQSLDRDIDHRNEAVEQVSNTKKYFTDIAQGSPAWSEFQSNLDQLLRQKSFNAESDLMRFDYLVMVDDENEKLSLNEIETIKKIFNQSEPFGLLGILNGSNLWLSGFDIPLSQKSMGRMQSHQMVYVACQLPKMDKIFQLADLSERLLFVRHCGKLSDIYFTLYFKEGAEGFARENPQASFMQLHLPSLQQVVRNHYESPFPQLASGHWQGPFFSRIGWKDPIWDQRIKAYRTQSVIEAVSLFRN